QSSSSSLKSSIPRSKSAMDTGSVHYPSLSSVVIEEASSKEAYYPALIPSRELPEPPAKQEIKIDPSLVPGTFTFHSDNTIDFGKPPCGFGASPGQSSIRQVRPSILP